jgi:hypothetical protein
MNVLIFNKCGHLLTLYMHYYISDMSENIAGNNFLKSLNVSKWYEIRPFQHF